MTVSLVCVDPARAAEIWPHVAPLLGKAFERQPADFTLEEVHKEVLAAETLIWIAWDGPGARILGVATTKIIKTARGKVLQITSTGGRELKRWRSFIADLEAYGIAEGCDKCRMYGRPGWKRIFPDYREPWITIEKEIGPAVAGVGG